MPACRPPRFASPRPLRRGDTIAVLAPASPFPAEPLDRACEWIADAGFRIRPAPHLRDRAGYLAGTDADRAEDLIQALTSPQIAAIVCARGGYGSSRLLDHIPFPSLCGAAKIFLGFSDITFLHGALLRQARWTTFHGPNLARAGATPADIRSLLETLSGRHTFHWALRDDQVVRPGTATGPVVGGNLTCLAHLIGTPYFPDLNGSLLLLEDRGEALYRLDRLINHLKLAGAFDRLAGLLLGQFTECGPQDRIVHMIARHVKPFAFPVVFDLPFGHTPANQTIPLGTPFVLNTYDHQLKSARSPFHAPE